MSREMGERYVLLEELLRDEREEGKAEGKDLEVLRSLYKVAVKASSVEEFVKNMQK